ncbi:MAG: nicotinate-nucleotide--dimethylbenzimidazole phosphoribosyltransferase [Rhizobiaceae bacterium]
MKIRESGLPFDDFRALLAQLPDANEDVLALTQTQITERFGEKSSVLGELCKWLAAWSGTSPSVKRPVLTLFAGTHSVDSHDSSGLLEEIAEISSGSAAINRVCHVYDLGLKVLDLALQIPVADITNEAALDEKSCAGTIAFGMEAIAGGTDLLCSAVIEDDFNVSNAAILTIVGGVEPKGIFSDGQSEKVSLTEEAVQLVNGHCADGFEILRRLGGRETAAICGAILAARIQHIPVLLGGPTAMTCLILLEKFDPGSTGHCMMAQPTGNPAVDQLAERVGVKFVLDNHASANPAIQVAIAAGIARSASAAFAINS